MPRPSTAGNTRIKLNLSLRNFQNRRMLRTQCCCPYRKGRASIVLSQDWEWHLSRIKQSQQETLARIADGQHRTLNNTRDRLNDRRQDLKPTGNPSQGQDSGHHYAVWAQRTTTRILDGPATRHRSRRRPRFRILRHQYIPCQLTLGLHHTSQRVAVPNNQIFSHMQHHQQDYHSVNPY